jgi:hypothetical protein
MSRAVTDPCLPGTMEGHGAGGVYGIRGGKKT